MTTDTFQTIPLAAIAPSLTNPRKAFNPERLAELVASIKASGVHQPILVRPLPGSRVAETGRKVTHEIVAGERRYRASMLAGATTIPALIRELSDQQVLEIQIVENLQRDDLTQLEEAEGYQQLMHHSQLTSDQVGAKIGKSRSYVYARLKLLDLSMECKDAMRAGQIDASRALLIARIPDTALQAKALKYAAEPTYNGDLPSVRNFQTWLQANVMLRLEEATFKITDSRLIAAAGSCKDCPKRTGANPDLFQDVAGADICTDPVCFHAKEDAHRTAMITQAEKKGMRFVQGDEAEDMFESTWQDRLDPDYTNLAQVRNDITTADGRTGLTLRELLGKDAPGAVLIENPRNKNLIEAVPTDELQGVLLAKGLLKALDQQDANKPGSKAAADAARELEHLQTRAQIETNRAVRAAWWQATKDAILATDDKAALKLLNNDVLRGWMLSQLDEYNIEEDDLAMAMGCTLDEGCDANDALALHAKSKSMGQAALCRAAAIVMMMNDNSPQSDYEPTILTALSAATGVPAKAIIKETTAKVKAEYAAQIAEVRKALTPTAPLAQPSTPPAAAKSKAGAKPPAKAKPAKLSAEEAQSGIAQAMQEAERAAPDAQQGERDARGSELCAGRVVHVTKDTDRLPPKNVEHAGKQGTITEKQGDSCWWVTFKGRTGGIACFDASELTAATGVAA